MTEDGQAPSQEQSELLMVHCPGCRGWSSGWASECEGVKLLPAPRPSRFQRLLEATGLFRP